MAASVASTTCDEKRRPCWPASASSTTPGSSGATLTALPRTSSKGSPGLSSSTGPSEPISSTSSEPPTSPPDPPPPAPRAGPPGRPGILDSIKAPAYVRNGRLDLLAANTLGESLYSPVFAGATGNPERGTVHLLAPRSDLDSSWAGTAVASDAVAILRAEAGRDPYDRSPLRSDRRALHASEEFRVRWAAHNVKFHSTGRQVAPPPTCRRTQPFPTKRWNYLATPVNASTSTRPSPAHPF